MNLQLIRISSCIVLALLLGHLVCPLVLRAEETGDTHPITAWPLVYSGVEGGKAQTDVIWPVFHYERQNTWERYAVRPLLFNYEDDPAEDYRQTSVLWPLNEFKRKKDDARLNLTLYWHGSNPSRSYDILFPIYWNGQGKDYSYFHLWPLAGVSHTGSYSEHSTLFPFFRYGEDPEKNEVDLHAFWPLVNYHSSPEYLSHRVLPLYWYGKGKDASGGFVFPYYWNKRGSYAANGVFPLWYSSRDAGLKTDFVLPLYYNHEENNEALRLLLPVYGKWQSGTSSLTAVTPLYVDYRRGDDVSLETGFPLYWDYRSGPSSFTTLFPLYFHSANSSLASEFTCWWPLYGSYRQGDFYKRNFLLMPLYSHYTDESLALSGWDVLWPLFNYESGNDRSTIRALPLFWYTRTPDKELAVGFPLYFSYKTKESSYLHVVPFYALHTRGEHFRQRYRLGFVYIDTEDTTPGAPYTRKDILFPLYSSLKEENRERSWLFPFYYRDKKPENSLALGSLCFLPPYYISAHSPQEDLLHVWPLFGSTREGSYQEYSSLWPLIRFGSDPQTQERLTHLVLYYRDATPDKTRTALFLLWFHTTTATTVSDCTLLLHSYERDSDKDRTKLAFLWLTDDIQAASYERVKDQSLTSRFLWRVLSYDRPSPDTSEFRFLWRLIRTSSTPQKDVLELNPFYYREQESDGSSYWAILGGLIGRENNPDGSGRMRYLWGL